MAQANKDAKQSDDNIQNDNKEKELPQIILGAMEFGRRLSFDDAVKVTKSFLDSGYKMIDTAFMYAGGDSERYLGQMNGKAKGEPLTKNNVLIATKVNPSAAGGLSDQGIKFQCETCFKRLECESCDLLYLHWPDHKVDIKESLKTMNELYKQGKFKRLGLSNYTAWQVK